MGLVPNYKIKVNINFGAFGSLRVNITIKILNVKCKPTSPVECCLVCREVFRLALGEAPGAVGSLVAL